MPNASRVETRAVDGFVFVVVHGENQFWCLRELKKLGGRRPAVFGGRRRSDAMMFPEDPALLQQVSAVVQRTTGVTIKWSA